MCSPKAPKTPDPVKVAQAQADANIKTAQTQTELNRFNQTSPFGSQSWSRDPNNPNSYTLSTQFDPRITNSINRGLDFASGNMDFANEVGQFGRNYAAGVGNRLNQPLDSAPDRGYAQLLAETIDKRLYDNDSNVRSAMGTARGGDALLKNTISRFGNVQNQDFNFNNAPNMPESNEATRQAVADAIYGRATSRLDPRFTQAGSDLESRLAAQGITQGSEAYNRELDNLMRAKNDAYSTAMQDAEIGSQSALNSQFANQLAARKQGVTEADMIRDQFSDEALVANQLAGGANSNAVNQMGSQIARGLAVPQIAGGLLQNELAGTMGSNMQRDQAMKELGGISDLYSRYSTPNTSFVPQFGASMGGAGTIGQTPIADATYNSYSGDMNRYAQQVGSRNNMMSGLAGLGGAALMAPAGTFAGIGAGGSAALAGLMAF